MSKYKLNDRQKRFVTEYVIDHNATQAALRAGYSPRTAYSQGQRLLKHVEVKKALKKLQNDIRKENIADAIEIEEFISLFMKGKIDEEVIVTESYGDGVSQARILKKQVSGRDRLRAAEILARRHGMFTDKLEISDSREKTILDDLSSQVGSNSTLEVDDLE